MEEIFSRVSVREYLTKPVEKEKVEAMMRAAMAAPSACNQQPWEFYVVNQPEVIQQLASCSPFAKCLLNAPLALVPCYRTENLICPEYHDIDLSACVENLLLEAHHLGLGAVWLGIAPLAERMEKAKAVLHLPHGLEVFAFIACGYPKEPRNPQNRYDASRVHWDFFA